MPDPALLTPDTIIWALIPFWVDEGRTVNEPYDTAQTKVELATAFRDLQLPWVWAPVGLHSVQSQIRQIAASRSQRPAVVFNFCDGVDAQGSPGLSVVRALEAARLPFTGADSTFFEISTSKLCMKRLFEAAGVPTPAFAELPQDGAFDGLAERLGTPLLVKPDVSAGSFGISLKSKVHTEAELHACRELLRTGEYARPFSGVSLFAERFVTGPEYTVFLLGDYRRPDSLRILTPAERSFDDSIPVAERFLSYDRYWGHYKEEHPPAGGRPFYSYRAADSTVAPMLATLARRAYCAAKGTGYGRVDIRMETATGRLFVLEVNANCGISDDDQTSSGCILRIAGLSFAELLRLILEDALQRHVADAPAS